MADPPIGDRLAKLADELDRSGELHSQPWRQAVLAVPRHLFVAGFYQQENTSAGTIWTPATPESAGELAYLDMIYANDAADFGISPVSIAEFPHLIECSASRWC